MIARKLITTAFDSRPARAVLGGFAKMESGRRLLARVGGPRAVFASFEEAWRAAGRGRHAGHDHPEAIATHLELSRRLRPSDYAALFWLLQSSREELCVFDFGGNAGNLFYSYIAHLRRKFRDCHWTVLDLPSVCAEGSRIAKERKAHNLRFTQSFAPASDAEVLLISGALHYWEGTIPEFLHQFEKLPEKVLINRTPVHPSADTFITVQQTHHYAVPCVVRNRRELVQEFQTNGFRLIDEWSVGELGLKLPLFPELSVPQYSGFYFEREPAS